MPVYIKLEKKSFLNFYTNASFIYVDCGASRVLDYESVLSSEDQSDKVGLYLCVCVCVCVCRNLSNNELKSLNCRVLKAAAAQLRVM